MPDELEGIKAMIAELTVKMAVLQEEVYQHCASTSALEALRDYVDAHIERHEETHSRLNRRTEDQIEDAKRMAEYIGDRLGDQIKTLERQQQRW